MVVTPSIWKQARNNQYIYIKIICTTIKSHVNSNEQNNLISNSYNVVVNSNLPRINVQTYSSFNTLITLLKETNTDSGVSFNDEIIDGKNISEEISYHHN